MNIDRNEECGFCGMPRHAHWGGSQALAAGRCAGFKSTAETRLRNAAPDLLAALKEFVHPYQSGTLTERELREKALAAIAKAEGRADG